MDPLGRLEKIMQRAMGTPSMAWAALANYSLTTAVGLLRGFLLNFLKAVIASCPGSPSSDPAVPPGQNIEPNIGSNIFTYS